MSRKKVLSIGALVVTAALSLSGCAAAPTGGGPTEGGYISIITADLSNPFFKAGADAAQSEAESLGYTADVVSHGDDPSKQSELIDAAINKGAVAIILDNAGAEASIGAIKKAVDADVPVFLFDREIAEAGVAKSQIVANNAQGASSVAETFAAALPEGGNYIELTGKESDTNAGVRSNAFDSVLSQYPNLTRVAQETANWSQDEAFAKVETLLQRDSNIQGIIAGNDTMALGAVAAVEAAGLLDTIKVAGFDGIPDAVDSIRAGKLLATGVQPAVLIAQLAVQQADQFLKTGETGAPEKQSVDCFLVTADNADKYTLFNLED